MLIQDFFKDPCKCSYCKLFCEMNFSVTTSVIIGKSKKTFTENYFFQVIIKSPPNRSILENSPSTKCISIVCDQFQLTFPKFFLRVTLHGFKFFIVCLTFKLLRKTVFSLHFIDITLKFWKLFKIEFKIVISSL